MDILTELPVKAWIIAGVLALLFLYFIVRLCRQKSILGRFIPDTGSPSGFKQF